MKQLMHQDAGQLARLLFEFTIEHDLALTNKRAGVDRLPARTIGIEAPAISGQRR